MQPARLTTLVCSCRIHVYCKRRIPPSSAVYRWIVQKYPLLTFSVSDVCMHIDDAPCPYLSRAVPFSMTSSKVCLRASDLRPLQLAALAVALEAVLELQLLPPDRPHMSTRREQMYVQCTRRAHLCAIAELICVHSPSSCLSTVGVQDRPAASRRGALLLLSAAGASRRAGKRGSTWDTTGLGREKLTSLQCLRRNTLRGHLAHVK